MEIFGGGMLVVQAATVLSRGARSRLQLLLLAVVKLTRAAVEAVGKERRPVVEASRHKQNDVSLSLAATLGPSGGVAAGLMDSGGLAVVKCLMTARMLVAGSLSVIGPSPGE